MVNFHLINFILDHFLQSNIGCLMIFNCWDQETQYMFSKRATENYFYIENIHMIGNDSIVDFKYRLKNHAPSLLGAFMDLNCHESENLLQTCSYERFFNDHYHWLIYDHMGNISYFRHLFSHYNLSINSDIVYAIPKENRQYNNQIQHYYGEMAYPLSDLHDQYAMNGNESIESYILYDVYNNGYHIGGKLNMTADREMACTHDSCRLIQYLSKLYLRRSKYANRNRMHDVTMRVTVVITYLPLNSTEEKLQEFLLSDDDHHIDPFARFGYKLTMLLKDMLGCNMSYDYYDLWVTSQLGGGVIGPVITESADLTSVAFLMTLPRYKYLQPICETSSFRTTCMFRTPRSTGAFKADVFLKPFSGDVWLLFVFCLIACSIFLWSTFHVEYRRMRKYLEFAPSILTTCLIAFGSACTQGSHLIPHTMSGRLAFLALSFISFIMYNYYTSLVVSSLLGSPIQTDIKTIDDLADSLLDVGLEPVKYTMFYLNTSLLSSVRRFVKRKIESKRDPQSVWMPIEEGIRRVREEPGFVYIFEASNGYPLIENLYEPHEICDLNEISLRPEKSLHTNLHKNSSFKELIRLRQLRMLETGVYARNYRYWIRTRLNCLDSNFVFDVGMEYAGPLFIGLLCAYILVIISLAIEIFYKKYADKKEKMKLMMNIDECRGD